VNPEDPSIMSDQFPIQVIQEHESLRLEWDNRQAPKDKILYGFFIIFWLIWLPVTVFVTCLAITRADGCLGVWCTCAWVGTFVIPYALAGTLWFEWIEVSPTAITHGRRGFLAPRPKVYMLGDGAMLNCGRDGNEESFVSLSLYLASSFLGIPASKRVATLAYWLSPRLKEQVFQAIREFVVEHAIPLDCKRT
jgi:hypothetical protein